MGFRSAATLEAEDDNLRDWLSDGGRRRAAWAAVCVAAASVALFVVDAGLVALALPRIEANYPDVSRTTIAWIAKGFLIAQAALLLVGGRLGDRRGRKRYFLVGLLMFSMCGGLAAVAPNVPTLILARVAQGSGAAFMTSGALALVLPMFPGVKAPVVVGTWGAIGSVAAWLTPTAGAELIHVHWRLGFAIVAPIGLAVWLVGRRVLPDDAVVELVGRTDRVSYYLGPPALGMMMLVLSQGSRWGWTSARTLGAALIATVLLATFVRRCRVVDTPLVDLSILGNRTYLANTIAGAFQQVGFFGWYLTGPLIMHELWGWSVRQTGFALALGQLLASVGSPLGGYLVGRFGYNPPVYASALVTGAGTGWLILTAGTEPNFWGSYLPAALMLGFGGGMCGTITTGAAMAALPHDMLGAGNSMLQLIRRLGGAFGVAAAVALIGEAKADALLPGARRVWWMASLIHVAMCVPLLWAARRRVDGSSGTDPLAPSTPPTLPTLPTLQRCLP